MKEYKLTIPITFKVQFSDLIEGTTQLTQGEIIENFWVSIAAWPIEYNHSHFDIGDLIEEISRVWIKKFKVGDFKIEHYEVRDKIKEIIEGNSSIWDKDYLKHLYCELCAKGGGTKPNSYCEKSCKYYNRCMSL